MYVDLPANKKSIKDTSLNRNRCVSVNAKFKKYLKGGCQSLKKRKSHLYYNFKLVSHKLTKCKR